MNNITDKLNMVTDYIKSNKNSKKQILIILLCVCVAIFALKNASDDSKEIKSEKLSYTNSTPPLRINSNEEFRRITDADIKKGDQPVSQFIEGIIHLDKNPICKGTIDYDSVNDAWICSYYDNQRKKTISVWFPNGKSRDAIESERMLNGGKYPSRIILGFAAVTPQGPLEAKKEKMSSSAAWIVGILSGGAASSEEITTRKFKNKVVLYRHHLKFPFTEQDFWNHLIAAWNAKIEQK